LVYLVAAGRGWTSDAFWSEHLTRMQAGGARQWLAGALVAAMLAADLILPVPSSVVMTLAGTLLGPWRGGLCSVGGAMASALLGFGLCRAFGRAAFARLVGEKETAQVQRLLDRYGVWAVVLSRSVPMMTEVVSCMAGLGGMSFRRFALCSVVGTLPICLVYAWAGAEGRDPAGIGWAVVLAFVLPAAGLGLIALVDRRAGVHGSSRRQRRVASGSDDGVRPVR
jgi:uncharacterized membrane protein YdjX (TVP38/TMEM64 family)